MSAGWDSREEPGQYLKGRTRQPVLFLSSHAAFHYHSDMAGTRHFTTLTGTRDPIGPRVRTHTHTHNLVRPAAEPKVQLLLDTNTFPKDMP